MTETDGTPPAPMLTPLEARVLGCLVEKRETTPDIYPLTVNAAQSAVNQKTARDPVMSVETVEVHRALVQLVKKGFARQAFASRAERFEHMFQQRLDLSQPDAVVLALLMLRGPQTIHELLARSERMTRLRDAEDVRERLERMSDRYPVLTVRLDKRPGQREERYAHLLCGPVEMSADDDERIVERHRQPVDDNALAQLEKRVQALEEQVRSLLEGR